LFGVAGEAVPAALLGFTEEASGLPTRAAAETPEDATSAVECMDDLSFWIIAL
jgi:hypothetical protein